MNAQHDVVVALLARTDDPAAQAELNRLALKLSAVVREHGFGSVTMLPLAGRYEIVETDRDGQEATPAPPDPEADEDQEPEAERDVLSRLSDRGVPITFNVLAGRKVACVGASANDATLTKLMRTMAGIKQPMRVIVLGGWSGEVPAAILAGAAAGTQVYCVDPVGAHRTDENWNYLPRVGSQDIDDLLRMVPEIRRLPGTALTAARDLDRCEADCIVVEPGCKPEMLAQLLALWEPHVNAGGALLGLHGEDDETALGLLSYLDPLGLNPQIDESGMWIIPVAAVRQAQAQAQANGHRHREAAGV